MTPRGTPYHPVRRVTADANSGDDQALVPAVSLDGTPRWQPGDTSPVHWAVQSIGWCHGSLDNAKITADVEGAVYLTGARAVVIVHDFAKGSRYRTVGVPSLTSLAINGTANRLSHHKARKETEGQFLVGQMRWPWISSVAWVPHGMKRQRSGTVRLGGFHRTEFGDQESVTLQFQLRNPSDTLSVVETAITRAREDRLSWDNLTDETRQKWQEVLAPSRVTAEPGHLAVVRMPGGFISMRQTAGNGGVSSASMKVTDDIGRGKGCPQRE